jgi:hypothetical protein
MVLKEAFFLKKNKTLEIGQKKSLANCEALIFRKSRNYFFMNFKLEIPLFDLIFKK